MAFDYTTYTDGSTEPADHAPKGATFRIDEMPYEMAKSAIAGWRTEQHRLERVEVNTLAMRGTTDDYYDGDEPARDRAVHKLRNEQQAIQLYIDTMSEWMNEDALRSGYVPSAEERRDSEIEDGLRGAA